MPRLCTAIPYMYYKEEMFCTTCLDLYLLPMLSCSVWAGITAECSATFFTTTSSSHPSSIFIVVPSQVASCHHDLSRRKRSRRRRRRWWCCWRRYCCRWKSLLLLFFMILFVVIVVFVGFFFYSASASISLLPQPAYGVYLRALIFSANESPPAAGDFHAEAFNLNFFLSSIGTKLCETSNKCPFFAKHEKWTEDNLVFIERN